MYVTISVSILQYFDKKKSFANGIAMCGAGISMLKYCICLPINQKGQLSATGKRLITLSMGKLFISTK